MIKIYGADAVRFFILSDSPPDKDIQWSNQGVNSAYKFLQKIWSLNENINNSKFVKVNKDNEIKLDREINNYIHKITNLINDFQFNVVIANIYEMFRLLSSNLNNNVSQQNMKKNFTIFLKILKPIAPHLASECLEKIGAKAINEWPNVNKSLIDKINIKLAVQVNGKTRLIFDTEKDVSEKSIMKKIEKDIRIIKHIEKKKIVKTIFVKNKILNILTEK